MAKNEILDYSGPNCVSYGYFIQYFVCKCSFRVISMIKIVIWDQSKPISLYLKIKKFKNLKFVNCTFIIHKNGSKTSIQPILKSNSTSFIFNETICEMKDKKVIHWGAPGGMGEPSKLHLGSVISVFTWKSKYITWIS